MKPPTIREADTIEAGVDLVYRIETAVADRCTPDARDRALLLIGRQHEGESR